MRFFGLGSLILSVPALRWTTTTYTRGIATRMTEDAPPPSRFPALPADVVVSPSVMKTLVVDGEPLALDELGPIIIKEDGRLGRLANWHEMTEGEQAQTMAFVAKRNAKRRKALLAIQAEQQAEKDGQ